MVLLIALVAASFITALELRVATEKLSSERFPKIYREVSNFISSVVCADPVAQNNLIEFCTLVAQRSYSVLGPGVAESPEDNDF